MDFSPLKNHRTDLWRNFLQNSLFLCRAILRLLELFIVEAILYIFISTTQSSGSATYALAALLQKLRRIRAALSLSLSKVVGQKASEPNLFDSLLTGAPSLSAQPQSLSKPVLLVVLVFSHVVCCWGIVSSRGGVRHSRPKSSQQP